MSVFEPACTAGIVKLRPQCTVLRWSRWIQLVGSRTNTNSSSPSAKTVRLRSKSCDRLLRRRRPQRRSGVEEWDCSSTPSRAASPDWAEPASPALSPLTYDEEYFQYNATLRQVGFKFRWVFQQTASMGFRVQALESIVEIVWESAGNFFFWPSIIGSVFSFFNSLFLVPLDLDSHELNWFWI